MVIALCGAAFLAFGLWFWASRPYLRFPLAGTARATVDSRGTAVIAPDHADVPYADASPFQKLDLFLPKAGGKAPVVVWIHGGGLTRGDKLSIPRTDFGPPPRLVGKDGPYQVQVPDVEAVTRRGYALVSLNYRLGAFLLTDAGDAIADVKAAIRFLKANAERFGLDGERIALWGNSMGGYLATMAAVTGTQPSPFDAPKLGNGAFTSSVAAVVVWYGAEDRMPPWLAISRYLPSARSLPKFLITNGDNDPVISPAMARRLNERILQVGGSSELRIVAGAGHEDPQFMQTQVEPTLDFIAAAFAPATRAK